jgi:hypothetical protein
MFSKINTTIYLSEYVIVHVFVNGTPTSTYRLLRIKYLSVHCKFFKHILGLAYTDYT